jgi:coenzyme F420 hydrogenase subunit beta
VKIQNAQQVAEWRLCVGCGACLQECENGNISLHDIINQGIRPIVQDAHCAKCMKCIAVCPGLGVSHTAKNYKGKFIKELRKSWGPILEVWEGYAADPEIRFSGSSGGAATAIALYCLDKGLAEGVVHVGKDETEPWRNKTVLSTNRQDLLVKTGSRYSPASPCDSLNQIESSSSPSVFIGKPCDIQGLRKAESIRTSLNGKALAIGIFCAGTPSTKGLVDLLKDIEAPLEEVDDIRFRGNGWPGFFSVRLKDGKEFPKKLTYMDAWGFLQRYRHFRCYLCPDGTSEFADISCGDPWYKKPEENDQGRSLVLVRTEKGRSILDGAIKAGYVHLEKVRPEILELSQINLLGKRRAIWGRLLAMKLIGIPTPKLNGFYLFQNWLDASFNEKARSIIGTIRRIMQRRYYHPLKYPQ